MSRASTKWKIPKELKARTARTLRTRGTARRHPPKDVRAKRARDPAKLPRVAKAEKREKPRRERAASPPPELHPCAGTADGFPTAAPAATPPAAHAGDNAGED